MLAVFHWRHGAYEGCSRGLWRLLGHANKTCFIALGANSCMISSSEGHSQGNSKTTRTITPPAHAIDRSRSSQSTVLPVELGRGQGIAVMVAKGFHS